ncbi:aldehyde dehydrogenase (NADP(+)) [Ferruginibacter sp. HRS2-29]|uniref:aldehyde dehydrogenase (NADP(+)) n=1 Tax=Ferruginibacter sp. HRS2-29 TaxID=2487334 RepID=UPI0020CEB520|nr:aldehyde dehydrogenase (NADP(+)) [Ferruginibacter sp. HRS2-29]MCP9751902.1 aldehyde dehydrogenase (NADP(+)) [Ferruginibacter sp. HRS2-29]
MFQDSTTEEIDLFMAEAWQAFHVYRKQSLKQRADFMRAIAAELKTNEVVLMQTAARETNLPPARLKTEINRTIFQLNDYARFCESGQWLDIRIDTANADVVPARPDIRKTLVPLGPVVVFGAANFPFAYSTAGGDTACALAAGCPVIVKAHPGHAETSQLVADAITTAANNCFMPKGIFTHIHGASSKVGEALVKHPYTKAVGFTGSFAGGKQLFDWGNQRAVPIPVFAEMSSVNPVFLLPEKITADHESIAQQYAASITLNSGQFCTNPGIIIGIGNDVLDLFVNKLSAEIKNIVPETMLHAGIYKNYVEKRAAALSQPGVEQVAVSATDAALNQGSPTIAMVKAQDFLANPLLQHEVFGPYSIIVRCADMNEMIAVANYLEGQLTVTLMGTENDIKQHTELVDILRNICGRFILNGVPTGVAVGLPMQHGGPFPATTDSRFTSVGADGIKRFARPVAYQNWSDELLPDELKDSNPLKIWRTVNNELKC